MGLRGSIGIDYKTEDRSLKRYRGARTLRRTLRAVPVIPFRGDRSVFTPAFLSFALIGEVLQALSHVLVLMRDFTCRSRRGDHVFNDIRLRFGVGVHVRPVSRRKLAFCLFISSSVIGIPPQAVPKR
jgi:hypothetical protein